MMAIDPKYVYGGDTIIVIGATKCSPTDIAKNTFRYFGGGSMLLVCFIIHIIKCDKNSVTP
jgi:hypothetical protein